MNRQDFIDKLNNVEQIKTESLWSEKIMDEAIKSGDKYIPSRPSGHHNLDIVKEECAELIQELSKYTRGKGDHYNTLQELADVCIGIRYVQKYVI